MPLAPTSFFHVSLLLLLLLLHLNTKIEFNLFEFKKDARFIYLWLQKTISTESVNQNEIKLPSDPQNLCTYLV